VHTRIERLLELPAAQLAPLIDESEQAGLRFVTRLAGGMGEWAQSLRSPG
jgi:hypothetical protein